MKFFAIFFLLSGWAYAQGSASYIPTTKLLKKKGYQLGLALDAFNTTDTVDADGKKIDRADGQSFKRYQGELSGYYGATSDLQFGLGIRYRSNQATIPVANSDDVSASGSGIQSTFASIMFAFEPVDQLQYTLEGMFRYTPYTNKEIQAGDGAQSLVLGDEGNEISGGLGLTYSSKTNNFLTVRGGYRRAGAHLSDELYYQVEGAMGWRYLALVAGVDGVSSMGNDAYEGKPLERPAWNTGTGLYNGENREWVTPYAGINFPMGDSWRVEFRGSQVVSGKSTDLGTAFGINLIKRVDKNAVRLTDLKFKSYDIEASITKLSPKMGYVVIDKGLGEDVSKGMRFDFFEFDYVGGNILVATGVVIKSSADTAIVKITQRYNMKKQVKEGLVGRALIK